MVTKEIVLSSTESRTTSKASERQEIIGIDRNRNKERLSCCRGVVARITLQNK